MQLFRFDHILIISPVQDLIEVTPPTTGKDIISSLFMENGIQIPDLVGTQSAPSSQPKRTSTSKRTAKITKIQNTYSLPAHVSETKENPLKSLADIAAEVLSIQTLSFRESSINFFN